MPDKEFLEEYPLYRKFKTVIPARLNGIAKVRINMSCPICKTNQTFAMTSEYFQGFEFSNFFLMKHP